MKEYKWNGKIFLIADEDLHLYPGAKEVGTKAKMKGEPKNKARKAKVKKEG